jgi:SAM-dependent methyltransferase
MTDPGRKNTLHSAQELEEAYRGRTWEHYRHQLATIVEFSPPGRILDVGAGTGLLVECFRKFGLPCIGLEGSVAGVRAAQSRGIPMVVGLLDDPLPFGDATFSSLVCNQVIEHLLPATAERLLAEARRVLIPGGILLIESPSPRDPVQRAEPGHINLYTPSRLRSAVRSAGFRILAERNGPISLVGRGRLRDLLTLAVMRLTGWTDLLSASANVVARRET